jgi:prepilin-type N-terminal cleavage/methylation domain-containing protein
MLSLRSFTLIELLVVIAIIAMLAGLLYPALGGVRTLAKKAKTRATVSQLGSALKAYYFEYGKWPSTDADWSTFTASNSLAQNQNLLAILCGTNGTLNNPGVEGCNPKKMVFFELHPKDTRTIDNRTTLVDSWGNPIMVNFDHDFNNTTIAYPNGTTIPRNFAVWSAGPDGVITNEAQANVFKPQNKENRDNITSWF